MISVIIPTLNEEHNLSKNLSRITNHADEVIVADANSSDATRQVAKQHGCTVVDGGLPSKARNKGFEASNGDQLFFLDADVRISEEFF